MLIKLESPSVGAALDNDATANQIIANLNVPELSPLERYAIANQLKASAELAANLLSDDALKFALREPNSENPAPNPVLELARQGKEFWYLGHYYQVQFNYEYNFGTQLVDGKIDPVSKLWKESVARAAELTKKAKAETKLRKGYEATILANHNLSPTVVDTIMKFNADKSRNDGAD